MNITIMVSILQPNYFSVKNNRDQTRIIINLHNLGKGVRDRMSVRM